MVFNSKPYMKKYFKSPKNKENHRQANKRYNQKESARIKHNERVKRYGKTSKGKLNNLKQLARRRQNLGFIQMFNNPFDKTEIIEWHHITDALVVALPYDLHRLYYDKYHRKSTMEIVKQIYLGGD